MFLSPSLETVSVPMSFHTDRHGGADSVDGQTEEKGMRAAASRTEVKSCASVGISRELGKGKGLPK